jgi:hypothetical protein
MWYYCRLSPAPIHLVNTAALHVSRLEKWCYCFTRAQARRKEKGRHDIPYYGRSIPLKSFTQEPGSTLHNLLRYKPTELTFV